MTNDSVFVIYFPFRHPSLKASDDLISPPVALREGGDGDKVQVEKSQDEINKAVSFQIFST